MPEVMIDLENKNALVALAYIKTNDNPLEVFCNYILYVLLSAPNNELRADELYDKVLEKFGLDMPQQMINVCTRILKKRNDILYLRNGAGYKAINSTFDIAAFDTNFLRLHEQEDRVINAILNYVNTQYKQSWSFEDTKNKLSTFLVKEGNAAKLFLHEDITTDSIVSPDWYISRYIQLLGQTGDSLEWQYLVEIINGIMIYQGVYQTNDYEQDRQQKFNGTCFYFDTKLVLRIMGYSWNAQVQAAKELLRLITEEYGGKVCVFEQTITEVSNALASAGRSYKNGAGNISNTELRVFAELNPTDASLFSETAESVRARINKSPYIHIVPEYDWFSKENYQFNIDVSGLNKYVQMEHPEWRAGTISNDVDVINQVNILRKNDYTQRYGGKHKLPVFVTTNTDLVYSVRNYAQTQTESDSRTSWNPHALPIVSDNMILFRLWVPVASKYTALPALTLSRYAYNAQNADRKYFETLRKTVLEYGTVNGVDMINLSDTRRMQLEDILVAETNGNSDNITEPIIATSIEELIKLENCDLHEQLDKSQQDSSQKDSAIIAQKNRIINLAAKPYYNKLGILKALIYCTKYWWLIAVCVLLLVSEKIPPLTANENPILNLLIPMIPFAIQLILFILGKILSNENLEYLFLKPMIRYSVDKFTKKIQSNLDAEEQDYKDEIVAMCLKNTSLLRKYERFWSKNPSLVCDV